MHDQIVCAEHESNELNDTGNIRKPNLQLQMN